jgi:hypothetical protein
MEPLNRKIERSEGNKEIPEIAESSREKRDGRAANCRSNDGSGAVLKEERMAADASHTFHLNDTLDLKTVKSSGI